MEKINGSVFKGMIESGCNNLNNRKAEVDALNVFPVPDGDTGTNMSLTFTNGLSEVNKSGSDSLPVVAKTLSRGLLMGARGNSGVILSQIFRGFNKAVSDREELTTAEFADAMLGGSKSAYKAVMRPVEGTILTVVRESTEAASTFIQAHPEATMEEYFGVLCDEAKKSLDHTPELLPVLKEAHVVDSGGCGLYVILEGFKAYLNGQPIAAGVALEKTEEVKNELASGYREEFILVLNEQGKHSFKEEKFRKMLDQMGNKLTLICDGTKVKLRINTMMPGDILTFAQRYGEFEKVQIENVQDDLKPSIIEEEPVESKEPETPIEEKEFGIISVCAGDGIKKLFTDYRVDIVVSGGQTMNPSTQDIVEAINKIPAKHIYVLPNNSNIVMAAKQAKAVIENKDIIVLETKSVPQGLSACIAFNPEESVENNTAAMQEAVEHVKSGSITYSIKDTVVDGIEIAAGDYMSLMEHDIIYTDKDKVKATEVLLANMCDEDTEIITILKGEDASEEEVAALEAFIEEKYDVDVDIEDGGQPVYSFIIGVE